MTDDAQAEWERRFRERERIDRIEALAKSNETSVRELGREVDGKIEKLAHNLVDQMSDRWDDKVALFEARMLSALDTRLADLREQTVSRKAIPDLVEEALEGALASKRTEVRGNFQFWFFIVLNTASITAAIATAVFWAVNFIKG